MNKYTNEQMKEKNSSHPLYPSLYQEGIRKEQSMKEN